MHGYALASSNVLHELLETYCMITKSESGGRNISNEFSGMTFLTYSCQAGSSFLYKTSLERKRIHQRSCHKNANTQSSCPGYR
jgi:hypothetical protein